jgi:nucleoside-diphosphate-sugar epimerase
VLLVTGITGHTGRYFLQELINHNYQDDIQCIVRETSDTSVLDNCGLKVSKAVGDLKDKEFVNACMKEANIVLHIVNIRHSLTIVDAAIKNNVSRVILVHTTGIYSKFKAASDEYKVIEGKLQEMMKGQQLDITILRPTMIYGDVYDRNMSKFIKMVDKLRIFPIINHGQCLIQPVNARDLGKAYYSVLTMPPGKLKQEYILSGQKPIEMRDAFKLISNYLGKKTTFISFPLCFGVFLARIVQLITLGKVDYVEKVQRMGEDRSFPHNEATRDFGYCPTSFEDGIKAEVAAYLKLNR